MQISPVMPRGGDHHPLTPHPDRSCASRCPCGSKVTTSVGCRQSSAEHMLHGVAPPLLRPIHEQVTTRQRGLHPFLDSAAIRARRPNWSRLDHLARPTPKGGGCQARVERWGHGRQLSEHASLASFRDISSSNGRGEGSDPAPFCQRASQRRAAHRRGTSTTSVTRTQTLQRRKTGFWKCKCKRKCKWVREKC